jgi:hypothetical protein
MIEAQGGAFFNTAVFVLKGVLKGSAQGRLSKNTPNSGRAKFFSPLMIQFTG